MGGGVGGFENFHMETFFLYAAAAANNFFLCLRLPANTFTFFYLHTICFSVQNFPTSPRPRQKISGPSLTNLGICRFLLAGFNCFI